MKGDTYTLILNLNHSDGAFALTARYQMAHRVWHVHFGKKIMCFLKLAKKNTSNLYRNIWKINNPSLENRDMNNLCWIDFHF